MDFVAPEEVGFSSARLNRINNLMQGYVDRGELPGLITTVARGGRTVHLEKFGLADKEAGRPMQFDAIFRIASMTKPVTAVAAMLLYEEGRFHLNTPVSRFVSAFKDTQVLVRKTESGLELADLKEPITFRHLFTHTAGLSYGWNETDPVDQAYREAGERMRLAGSPVTSKALLEGLAALPLAFQPGTHWRYSLSIDVIGYLVELIAGMTLGEFCRRRIFEPLGMADTAFYVPDDKVARLAAVYGHSPDKDGLQRVDLPVPTQPPDVASGGGGLFSTAGDYARFAHMLASGGELDGERLLSPRTVALFAMNQAPDAALPYGFAENDLYHAGYGYSLGTRVLMDVARSGIAGTPGEFGWDGAFATYFWVDLKEALYGVLMTHHRPNAYYPVAQQFKQLVYQALVE